MTFHVKLSVLGSAPVKSFQQLVDEQLAGLREAQLLRRAREVDGPQDTYLSIGSHRVLCLCSNNYLGLARHPAVAAAARHSLDEEGVGSAASPQISGRMQLHRRAEQALATFVGHESSLLFASGYACNVGILQALAGREDLIFSDRLNHASLIDGARLSRARVVIYEHGDVADLEQKLRQHRALGRGALIVTESLFSMDGDVAPLIELRRLAASFDAGLVVDEAHALGVLGPEGKGLCAEVGVLPDLVVGTLGKAFGVQGAFAAGAAGAVELLRNRARSYVFSTAPSPVLSAAALASLRLVRECDAPRQRLREHWRRLRTGLSELGYRVLPGDTPIIPVLSGSPEQTMQLSQALFERGVFVHGVRPPTVPPGTSRLRVVPMASHSPDDISLALSVFQSVRP